MNNMIYVGIGVLVIVIIAGVFLLGSNNNTAATTTAVASTAPNYSTVVTTTAAATTTTNTSYTTVNPYNTTTTIAPSNLTNSSIPSGCTATKYYTCSNASYSNAVLKATIGQNTGENWSSFGVAFAPQGTTISQGVPTDIPFYTANASSTSNVGTSLLSGATAAFQIPVSGNNSAAVGTLWVCYVNSRILYVGNGCTTNGGAPATYVEVATINT